MRVDYESLICCALAAMPRTRPIYRLSASRLVLLSGHGTGSGSYSLSASMISSLRCEWAAGRWHLNHATGRDQEGSARTFSSRDKAAHEVERSGVDVGSVDRARSSRCSGCRLQCSRVSDTHGGKDSDARVAGGLDRPSAAV